MSVVDPLLGPYTGVVDVLHLAHLGDGVGDGDQGLGRVAAGEHHVDLLEQSRRPGLAGVEPAWTVGQARAWLTTAELLAATRLEDLLAADTGQTTLAGNWMGVERSIALPDGGTVRARVDDGGNCFNLNSLVERRQDGTLVARAIGRSQFEALMTGEVGLAAAASSLVGKPSGMTRAVGPVRVGEMCICASASTLYARTAASTPSPRKSRSGPTAAGSSWPRAAASSMPTSPTSATPSSGTRGR